MFKKEYECNTKILDELIECGFNKDPIIEEVSLDILADCRNRLSEAFNRNEEINNRGLYFWIVNIGKKRYQLYIGSADRQNPTQQPKFRGVVGRLNDYFGNFLPLSPNDFKIQFFDRFIKEQNLECSYTIYFSKFKENSLDLRPWETVTRNKFNCIFGNKAVFTNGFKKEIAEAYYKVYKNQHFTAKLKN